MLILDVQGSGSIRGNTRSHNRYGQYERNRRIPVNPRTPPQTARRAAQALCASTWRGLSPDQRFAWQSQAAYVPFTDSLGQVHTLSGEGFFCSINLGRIRRGQVLLSDPLAILTFPDVSAVSAVGDASAQSLSVNWLSGNFEDGDLVEVYAGPPRSSGVSFDVDLRFLGFAAPDANTLDIAAAWRTQWGTIPVAKRIFVAVRPVAGGVLADPDSAYHVGPRQTANTIVVP